MCWLLTIFSSLPSFTKCPVPHQSPNNPWKSKLWVSETTNYLTQQLPELTTLMASTLCTLSFSGFSSIGNIKTTMYSLPICYCSSSSTNSCLKTLKLPSFSRFSQMGLCNFTPWNGLKNMGISISAKPQKLGKFSLLDFSYLWFYWFELFLMWMYIWFDLNQLELELNFVL